MSSENDADSSENDADNAAGKSADDRVYEQSGCYPESGKAFRVWALLGWLTFVIVALAGTAALLNILLLPAA